eukprot:136365_1
MTEFVWKLDDIALKQRLIKLHKSKLIRLCKKKKIKVSSNATKQDIVNALMKQNKAKNNTPIVNKRKKTKNKGASIKKNIPKDTSKQKNNMSSNCKTQTSTSVEQKINMDDLHANYMTMSNTKSREFTVSAYCRDLIKLLTKDLTDKNVAAIQQAINILKMIEEYCNPDSHAYYKGYTKQQKTYQVFGSKVNLLINGYNREIQNKFNLPNIGKDVINLISLYYEIMEKTRLRHGCFIADTKILTANNEQINMNEIKIGQE